jgi:hypothetical protein
MSCANLVLRVKRAPATPRTPPGSGTPTTAVASIRVPYGHAEARLYRDRRGDVCGGRGLPPAVPVLYLGGHP